MVASIISFGYRPHALDGGHQYSLAFSLSISFLSTPPLSYLIQSVWIRGSPVVWLTTVLTNLSKTCWMRMAAVSTLPSYRTSRRGSSTVRVRPSSCCTPTSKPSDSPTVITCTSSAPSSSAKENASW